MNDFSILNMHFINKEFLVDMWLEQIGGFPEIKYPKHKANILTSLITSQSELLKCLRESPPLPDAGESRHSVLQFDEPLQKVFKKVGHGRLNSKEKVLEYVKFERTGQPRLVGSRYPEGVRTEIVTNYVNFLLNLNNAILGSRQAREKGSLKVVFEQSPPDPKAEQESRMSKWKKFFLKTKDEFKDIICDIRLYNDSVIKSLGKKKGSKKEIDFDKFLRLYMKNDREKETRQTRDKNHDDKFKAKVEELFARFDDYYLTLTILNREFLIEVFFCLNYLHALASNLRTLQAVYKDEYSQFIDYLTMQNSCLHFLPKNLFPESRLLLTPGANKSNDEHFLHFLNSLKKKGVRFYEFERRKSTNVSYFKTKKMRKSLNFIFNNEKYTRVKMNGRRVTAGKLVFIEEAVEDFHAFLGNFQAEVSQLIDMFLIDKNFIKPKKLKIESREAYKGTLTSQHHQPQRVQQRLRRAPGAPDPGVLPQVVPREERAGRGLLPRRPRGQELPPAAPNRVHRARPVHAADPLRLHARVSVVLTQQEVHEPHHQGELPQLLGLRQEALEPGEGPADPELRGLHPGLHRARHPLLPLRLQTD